MTQHLPVNNQLQNIGDTKMKRLRVTIQKKRLYLQELVTKIEMLRVNLEMTKQEYMVKIGNLILKDNKLDFEIIRLNNILYLMKEGLSYEEAVRKIASSYYTQEMEFEREQESLEEDGKIYQQREMQNVQLNVDMKKIWKKLITKFHPDLVQDPNEKKKRDAIMKQINRAYEENDYDQLVRIDHENVAAAEMTVDNLEEILIKIEQEIVKQKETHSVLKKSEWYDWMIKIERVKKKSINIFADSERRLLDDIVAKIVRIKQIKLQIENLGGSQL